MSGNQKNLQHDAARAARAAEVLRAVAHVVRLRIVAALRDGAQSVGALAESLGLGQATVSQQLRILRMQRLVEADRQDGFAYYRLAEPRLRQLVRCLEGCELHD
jgi:ArsR family transcriptional regulator